MSRHLILGAAAFAALAVSPVSIASAQDITVSGPRSHIVREPSSMLQVSVLTGSVTVNYADLDLRSLDGRDALRARVRQAAMRTCNKLDSADPSSIALSGPDECLNTSMASAQPQINRAVALYGG